jgi:hypothetical protein
MSHPDKSLIENLKKKIAESLLNESNKFKIKNRKNPEIAEIGKTLLSPFNTKNVNLKELIPLFELYPSKVREILKFLSSPCQSCENLSPDLINKCTKILDLDKMTHSETNLDVLVQNDSTNSNSSSFIPKSNSIFENFDFSKKVSNSNIPKIEEKSVMTSSDNSEKVEKSREKMSGRKIAETVLIPFLEKQLKIKKENRNIYVS